MIWRPTLCSLTLWAAISLGAAMVLAGCGQKGPLVIPQTPAAAQRATLPQTLWGGGKANHTDAAHHRAAPTAPRPLPDLPDAE